MGGRAGAGSDNALISGNLGNWRRYYTRTGASFRAFVFGSSHGKTGQKEPALTNRRTKPPCRGRCGTTQVQRAKLTERHLHQSFLRREDLTGTTDDRIRTVTVRELQTTGPYGNCH
uniref:Uncharacterized protein n=1 Tax=Branchiostoma floridae TaxID=7739 RepID=C3ZZ50_BRAFL|eukprot:XP_002586150.1 hypothetical protein BRAFLDRAFT_109847 [Branchiostoma floridae]